MSEEFVRVDTKIAQAAFDRAAQTHKQEFGEFFLFKFLGLEIRYDDHSSIVEAQTHDYMFNPQGFLHGGVISTIADITMGHLVRHQLGTGVTIEMKVQFLRPVRGERIRCVATFLKKGRTISYLDASLTNSAGELVAKATSTWSCRVIPVLESSQDLASRG